VIPELPQGFTPDANQLDRIEGKLGVIRAEVALVVARVSRLEGKSSFWGAVGGAAMMLVTKLGGCA
jgi:hypothetical protein